MAQWGTIVPNLHLAVRLLNYLHSKEHPVFMITRVHFPLAKKLYGSYHTLLLLLMKFIQRTPAPSKPIIKTWLRAWLDCINECARINWLAEKLRKGMLHSVLVIKCRLSRYSRDWSGIRFFFKFIFNHVSKR